MIELKGKYNEMLTFYNEDISPWLKRPNRRVDAMLIQRL